MELWIRSQDRENLIFIKGKLELYKGKFIQTSISPYMTEQHYGILYKDNRLGEYKSKERALEVLYEIQKLLQPQILIKKGKIRGSFDNTIIREADGFEIKELSTYVYEMPKE